jgi:hypothetical protein
MITFDFPSLRGINLGLIGKAFCYAMVNLDKAIFIESLNVVSLAGSLVSKHISQAI